MAVLCAVASLNLEAQDGRELRLRESPSSTGIVFTRDKMPGLIPGQPQFGVLRFPTPFAIQPLLSSFYWTAPIYGPHFYMTSPYVFVQEAPPSYSNRENERSYKVQRLVKDIQRLRNGKQLRTTRQAAPQPPPPEETTFPPTTLIFRDGHQMEIQNYAIVGQTLWVFAEQGSTRISVTDLDLETTQKVNMERGVHFPLPQ
jgi:hypothetical protein